MMLVVGILIGACAVLGVFLLACALERSRLRTSEWLLVHLIRDPRGHHLADLTSRSGVPSKQIERTLEGLASYGVVARVSERVWRLNPAAGRRL